VILTRERIQETLDEAAERGRLVRSADRAPRTVGVGPSFPILGYDDLTASQVQARLEGLTPAELRKGREYERRHANRKSVLAAIEASLSGR